jgi:serine/threonine protein kinase
MAQAFHRYRAGDKPVGGHKLIRKLGEGGFGEVWQASAPGGAEVALKFIDLTGQQGLREFKFLRLVKNITHINLTPLHGFWLKNEDGTLIDESDITWSQLAPSMPDDSASPPAGSLATSVYAHPVELIVAMGLGKKSLYDRLRECKDEGLTGIPVDELLEYMEDAAKGIDYLNRPIHDMGQGPMSIVHSDIKPHNILIVGDGAQVCDFGLAHAVESLRKTCQAPLTLAYAAPESFRGKPCDKSDQYSLAISYVELRTGSLPFDENMTGFEVMTAHVQRQLDFSRLTPAEQSVIRKATAPLPQDRWPNSREMVAHLHEALNSMPSDLGIGRLGGSPTILDRLVDDEPCVAREARTLARDVRATIVLPTLSESGSSPYADQQPNEPDPALDAKLYQNVQFTVYRPQIVRPMEWRSLLTFAHLSERPPDASNDELDPIDEVKRLAAAALGSELREYRQTTLDSRDAVPHDGELVVVPEMDGVEFNPNRQAFRFNESVHKVEFRFRAAADRDQQTLRGRLSVFFGAILMADVPLQIRVDCSHAGDFRAEPTPMRRYRNIFASYSHRDLAIVEQFEQFAATLGDRYVRDWKDLRAGEKWDDRLRGMIEEADIFQIFWSRNSMLSPFCRQEWEHALSLGRDNFIRPTYWEDPFPESSSEELPPESLRRLHFTRLLISSGTEAKKYKSNSLSVDRRQNLQPQAKPSSTERRERMAVTSRLIRLAVMAILASVLLYLLLS